GDIGRHHATLAHAGHGHHLAHVLGREAQGRVEVVHHQWRQASAHAGDAKAADVRLAQPGSLLKLENQAISARGWTSFYLSPGSISTGLWRPQGSVPVISHESPGLARNLTRYG